MGLGILPPPGVAPAKAPLVQDFVSSGTWTKPDGARLVLAELIGAGGGGNSSMASGGGGAYARMLFDANALAATESVTVGAGGAGVTSGTSGTGGSSSFAGLTAHGGGGTNNPNSVNWGLPGGLSLSSVLANNASSQYGGGSGSNNPAYGSSEFGAGGGTGNSTPLLGGTEASKYGALKAGNGGSSTTQPTAPGGGGSNGATPQAGARGQVRITTHF